MRNDSCLAGDAVVLLLNGACLDLDWVVFRLEVLVSIDSKLECRVSSGWMWRSLTAEWRVRNDRCLAGYIVGWLFTGSCLDDRDLVLVHCLKTGMVVRCGAVLISEKCFAGDTAVVLLNGACLDLDLVVFRLECDWCSAFVH